MSDLNKAQNELVAFLIKNPNMLPLQEKIEKQLNSVPEHYRVNVIARLLIDSLDEMVTELKMLQVEIGKLNG